MTAAPRARRVRHASFSAFGGCGVPPTEDGSMTVALRGTLCCSWWIVDAQLRMTNEQPGMKTGMIRDDGGSLSPCLNLKAWPAGGSIIPCRTPSRKPGRRAAQTRASESTRRTVHQCACCSTGPPARSRSGHTVQYNDSSLRTSASCVISLIATPPDPGPLSTSPEQKASCATSVTPQSPATLA